MAREEGRPAGERIDTKDQKGGTVSPTLSFRRPTRASAPSRTQLRTRLKRTRSFFCARELSCLFGDVGVPGWVRGQARKARGAGSSEKRQTTKAQQAMYSPTNFGVPSCVALLKMWWAEESWRVSLCERRDLQRAAGDTRAGDDVRAHVHHRARECQREKEDIFIALRQSRRG